MEHGQFQHKQLYEELLHVPLVIRFAGEMGERFRGRRENARVRLIDVFPTSRSSTISPGNPWNAWVYRAASRRRPQR